MSIHLLAQDRRTRMLTDKQLAQLEVCACGAMRLDHVGDRCLYGPYPFREDGRTDIYFGLETMSIYPGNEAREPFHLPIAALLKRLRNAR